MTIQLATRSGFPDYGFAAYICHFKHVILSFLWKTCFSGKNKLENHSINMENQTWSLTAIIKHYCRKFFQNVTVMHIYQYCVASMIYSKQIPVYSKLGSCHLI